MASYGGLVPCLCRPSVVFLQVFGRRRPSKPLSCRFSPDQHFLIFNVTHKVFALYTKHYRRVGYGTWGSGGVNTGAVV